MLPRVCWYVLHWDHLSKRTGASVGYSSRLNEVVGQPGHLDPAPILVVQGGRGTYTSAWQPL